MSHPVLVLFWSFLAGAATLFGIYLAFVAQKWVLKNTINLISLASGVLLSSSLAFLLPESIELAKNAAFTTILVTFLAFYLLEHTLILHRHSEIEHPSISSGQVALRKKDLPHTFGLISLVGLFFHSFIDGVAIGAGFEVSTQLGILATISVLLHEVPEGISAISVLLHAGFDRRRAMTYSWIVALATPFGAVLTLLFLPQITPQVLGIFVAVAAGSFLYVAATDLIPEVQRRLAAFNWVLVFLGAALPFFLDNLL